MQNRKRLHRGQDPVKRPSRDMSEGLAMLETAFHLSRDSWTRTCSLVAHCVPARQYIDGLRTVYALGKSQFRWSSCSGGSEAVMEKIWKLIRVTPCILLVLTRLAPRSDIDDDHYMARSHSSGSRFTKPAFFVGGRKTTSRLWRTQPSLEISHH
jgi:hypothetical protein